MGVLAVSGSPSSPSRSGRLLEQAALRLEESGVEVDRLSIRDLPPLDLVHGRHDSPLLRKIAARIEAADGVILATPIYKAAASGLLKLFLDLLPPSAFAGKVILPIGVGGGPAHALAVDYSLRPVLAALGATRVLATLYATERELPKEGDTYLLDEALAARLEATLGSLRQELPKQRKPLREPPASVRFANARR